MFSEVFGQSASNFRYQAARPACGKGRPPHMADDGHSAAVLLIILIIQFNIMQA